MSNLFFLKGILFLIIGLFILLLFSYFVYLIFKKYKKTKVGKVAGICFFIFSSLTIGIIIKGFPFLFFENYFFFKKDVYLKLDKLNVVLSNDFKILDNNISEFTSSVHTFTLEISEQDEKKLIKGIKFKPNFNNTVLIRLKTTKSYDEKIVLNTEKHTLYYEYIQY